jgi:hypothetical protein
MIGAIGAHITKLGMGGMFLLALAMLAGNAWMFFSINPRGIGGGLV